MPSSFFSIFLLLFFFLSCAPLPLIYTTGAANNRRTLHQPFFPQDSFPPTQPPSPPPPSAPKYPFTTSSPDQPFFPSIPTPPLPPSPPAPTNFASFPANISSLILPQSPKSKHVSSKLVAVAVALVVSAVVLAAISICLFVRRQRRRSFSDDKTSRSNSTNGVYRAAAAAPGNGNANVLPKPRRSPPNSSEFLYLGTIVNSHGGGDVNPRPAPSKGTSGSGGAEVNLRKLDSPELRPLPPLSQQNSRQFYPDPVTVTIATEEEDDEFYSPRGSAGGRESSIGTGSASRRTFAAVGAADFDISCLESSSSSSRSSSASDSPNRSVSLSISPPVSVSPRSSRPKSPELVAVQTAPVRPAMTQFDNLDSSASTSPERASEKSLDSSPRISTISIPKTVSPARNDSVLSSHLVSPSPSSLTSPERHLDNTHDPSQRIWNDSNQNGESPVRFSLPGLNQLGGKWNSPTPSSSSLSSSPEMSPVKTLDPSHTRNENDDSILNLMLHKNNSRSPSLSPLSSPERQLEESPDSSPRLTDMWELNLESPARISSAIEKHVPISVAPPPLPPPPPPPPPGHWDSPIPAPSSNPFMRPPVLVSPSRPVVFHSPPSISPMELPPGAELEDTPKPKLKPLHWDKVRASSDREMVWDQLRSSSFKLNEEMIETLFVAKTPNSNSSSKESARRPLLHSPNQENRVLDPKKAQNIAISLRALNVTIEEVCEALWEGNADTLGTELLESLLKMAPSKEEERRLKEYKDDSPSKLGPAERFLMAVLDVPFAFKRVDAMLYIANFESEVEYLKRSFDTLEAACEELRNNRMFLKLLEAVLKTGNRMNVGTNRGDAHAFKLDTLLKLVDVKGADGKTTLLHFVVQEMIRSEGARLSSGSSQTSAAPSLNDDVKCRKLGLQVVSGLSSDLTNVKKAATMDSDVLNGDVMKLSQGIGNITEVVRLIEEEAVVVGSEESCSKFCESMNSFMKMAEEDIIRIQAQESVALSLVKEITEYFHGNSAKEEAHPFRIFLVVRDFLATLDRVCKEVGMINERTIVSSAHAFPVPVNPMLQSVNSGFPGKKQNSSSDDEN